MSLRRARARRVDPVLSVTLLMERSVQVRANDIHDPYHLGSWLQILTNV